MDEILPGVWHWSAEHPNIHRRVSSYYLQDAGAAIDPLLPEGDGIGALGDWPVQRVILTCRHHRRDAPRLQAHYGAAVLVPRAGVHEFEHDDALDVQPYDPGDEVASGVRVHRMEVISPDDEALHINAGPGALAFADGLVHYGGEIGFVPERYMDDPPAVKARTFERLPELLELDFDALLFAHGEPIPTGGRDRLAAFIGSAG